MWCVSFLVITWEQIVYQILHGATWTITIDERTCREDILALQHATHALVMVLVVLAKDISFELGGTQNIQTGSVSSSLPLVLVVQ